MTEATRQMGIGQLLRSFSDGLSPVTVAEELLAEARLAGERHHHILAMDADAVIASARLSENRWKTGTARPLEGIPIASKGSVEFSNLLADAGAYMQCVVVPNAGGTPLNQPEGMDPTNPGAEAHMPGGSSTGSAIALACRHVPAAIGSDAAGSIRIPSLCCHVVGLKPSRGALGPALQGLSPTLCEIGPMARSVEDAALLYAAMSGQAAGEPLAKPPIFGIFDDASLPPAMMQHLNEVANRLGAQGAFVVRRNIPDFALSAEAGWTVLCYEAAHNMADMLPALRNSPTSYLKYVEKGLSITATAYQAALAFGAQFAAGLDRVLEGLDALMCASAWSAVPRRNDSDIAEITAKWGELCLPFNLSGHPALALQGPNHNGLPTGFQLVGHRGSEVELLASGVWVQRSTDYHLAM
ncbi:amidase [Aureimonas fodinaquatilis]|uniref:Amidase n=1 Tax=Aureimonas fodinaquatilis TaxID=2565783 RepID=A0A5B0DWM0_9HYPH|nr:amidase [Aureimonas fodinaquatilis]KAA0970758.1 amidase [Aureimonas fodinaquatilis]